jgi:hypothetical protein
MSIRAGNIANDAPAVHGGEREKALSFEGFGATIGAGQTLGQTWFVRVYIHKLVARNEIHVTSTRILPTFKMLNKFYLYANSGLSDDGQLICLWFKLLCVKKSCARIHKRLRLATVTLGFEFSSTRFVTLLANTPTSPWRSGAR